MVYAWQSVLHHAQTPAGFLLGQHARTAGQDPATYFKTSFSRGFGKTAPVISIYVHTDDIKIRTCINISSDQRHTEGRLHELFAGVRDR